MTNADTGRPGSRGEHELQERHGNAKRAKAFYDNRMLDQLTPLMREFIAQQTMAFIATADAHGECDSSSRAGPAGFVRVLDEKTVMWPEYKGNGVTAPQGNITENAHVGLRFVDFFETAVGLHVNGRASVVADEAYIHCSKHITMLARAPEDEQSGRRAGDVFKAKDAPRPWLEPESVCDVPDEIGVATLAEVPTHSPSGRRLPLPLRN